MRSVPRDRNADSNRAWGHQRTTADTRARDLVLPRWSPLLSARAQDYGSEGGTVTRPRLLDLFCGAGGAAMGYRRAGFDVTGVDIEPQPRYPFAFVQADAMTFPLDGFDAIHASPPCQDHMRGGLPNVHGTGWMLAETRRRLEAAALLWVIENVPGAAMRPDYLLCGSRFSLPIRRHRWFETSWHGFELISCDHSYPIHGVYGRPHGRQGAAPGMLPDGLAEWSIALGINWMNTDELAQAIPPAYTEYIGAQLLEHLAAEAYATAKAENDFAADLGPEA